MPVVAEVLNYTICFVPTGMYTSFYQNDTSVISNHQRKRLVQRVTFPLQLRRSRSRNIFHKPILYAQLTYRVCRVCKSVYDPAENHPTACRFHTAQWTGAERSKFFGRIPETVDGTLRGIEYYYDCCDAKDQHAPGCSMGFHCSYDDE